MGEAFRKTFEYLNIYALRYYQIVIVVSMEFSFLLFSIHTSISLSSEVFIKGHFGQHYHENTLLLNH